MRVSLAGLSGAIMGFATCLSAQDAGLTPDMPRLETEIAGLPVTVTRSGPACPPACLQPIEASPGVAPIGEAELVAFLAGPASGLTGLLIDTRAPADFAQMTLPGAISVPRETLGADNPYRAELLAALGLTSAEAASYALVLFGQNALDPAPVAAIRALSEAGYPPAAMRYYRAGLDGWSALGLSTGSGS